VTPAFHCFANCASPILPALDSTASPIAYSLIIATFERPEELEITLASITAQQRPPRQTIIIDSSRDDRTEALATRWSGKLPLRYEHSDLRSAAQQRNRGARLADPTLDAVLGFLDDDITLYPDTTAKVLRVFETDPDEQTGGVSVRLDEVFRPEPHGLLWWYYRLQAGFPDRTYGGRLFGPAINCLPCYTESDGDLISADWLNSGCVFYRTAPFLREEFPLFDGYSFMEDVHLSARIARTHRLYFHTTARCQHRDGNNALKRDVVNLARQRIHNQRVVAKDVLGLSGAGFELKLLLHKAFASISVVRRREPAWKQELLGTWT
jgi:glycosyltransferase involved in cell wall biosynthesis